MAYAVKSQHSAPSKYLHLHAMNDHASVLGGTKRADTSTSDGTCTLSSATSMSSPLDVSDVYASTPMPPQGVQRRVNTDALSDDVSEALRFCDDLLLMDDGELAVTVILVKRCIDTGLPVGASNVHVFVLAVALLACKLQRDETYTLEEVARASGFTFEVLGSAEWHVFG